MDRKKMKFEIRDERVVFDDHYKIKKAIVRYDSFSGKEISTVRLAFERGDSVGILLFEKETGSILLTDQFRYPACKHNRGWLLEIVAGSLEGDENPEQCIIREVREEIGYEIEKPRHLMTFYTSPGASTERMFLYFSEVSAQDRKSGGGGKEDEDEDIQLVRIRKNDIHITLDKIEDAKTIIALQWFLLNPSYQEN